MSDARRDDTDRPAAAGVDERGAALRERFAAPPRGAAVGSDCPAPERFWDAAHDGAPPDEIAALADHVAACAPCTVAWRIAREEALSASGGARAVRRGRPRSGLRAPRAWMGLAAAVLVVALAGLAIRFGAPGPFSGRTSAPQLRSPADRTIASLVPESAVLGRRACVLKWSDAGTGARYRIEVTDERLDLVAESQGLERAEYQVPEEALAAVPPGGRILWRIQAERPDGWKAVSPTFAARVE